MPGSKRHFRRSSKEKKTRWGRKRRESKDDTRLKQELDDARAAEAELHEELEARGAEAAALTQERDDLSQKLLAAEAEIKHLREETAAATFAEDSVSSSESEAPFRFDIQESLAEARAELDNLESDVANSQPVPGVSVAEDDEVIDITGSDEEPEPDGVEMFDAALEPADDESEGPAVGDDAMMETYLRFLEPE